MLLENIKETAGWLSTTIFVVFMCSIENRKKRVCAGSCETVCVCVFASKGKCSQMVFIYIYMRVVGV